MNDLADLKSRIAVIGVGDTKYRRAAGRQFRSGAAVRVVFEKATEEVAPPKFTLS